MTFNLIIMNTDNDDYSVDYDHADYYDIIEYEGHSDDDDNSDGPSDGDAYPLDV